MAKTVSNKLEGNLRTIHVVEAVEVQKPQDAVKMETTQNDKTKQDINKVFYGAEIQYKDKKADNTPKTEIKYIKKKKVIKEVGNLWDLIALVLKSGIQLPRLIFNALKGNQLDSQTQPDAIHPHNNQTPQHTNEDGKARNNSKNTEQTKDQRPITNNGISIQSAETIATPKLENPQSFVSKIR